MDTFYLLIILDGARYDVFKELFSAGELPHLRVESDPQDVIPAVSTFPSTTGPAHLPMLTGKTPGECNVPGIRWFDREKFASRKFFFRFRSYVGFGAFLIDADVNRDIKFVYSLFERPFTVFASVNRGVPVSRRLGYFTRVYLTPYGRLTGEWMDADITAGQYVRRAIRRGADFVHAVFPAIDELSHHGHPLSEEVREAYRQFDRIFASIVDEAHKAGFKKVKFAVVSDHGLWKTYEHLDLDRLLERHFGNKVFYYPKTTRAWNNPEIINMISGNGMSHIYVRSSNGWSSHPLPEEIYKKGVVDILLEREEVDLVLVRASSREVQVVSREGRARLYWSDTSSIVYEPIYGDPLDVGGPFQGDRDEVLARTIWRTYPDAPFAVLQLLTSPRSGDVFVTARPGYDLRAKEFEIPEHLSTHGSLHWEHMRVPVVTNLEAAKGKAFLRTSDIFEMFANERR